MSFSDMNCLVLVPLDPSQKLVIANLTASFFKLGDDVDADASLFSIQSLEVANVTGCEQYNAMRRTSTIIHEAQRGVFVSCNGNRLR